MADVGDDAPHRPVQDALVRRATHGPDHAVVAYTGDDLSRPRLGPANPFRDDSSTALTLASASSASSSAPQKKRKNVLTGHAEETFISEHTFRAKHRAVERAGAGGPQREGMSSREQKEVHTRLRAEREGKGDATVADGDGAYVGPWAKYRRERYEVVEVEEGDELGSGDEEYEIVEEDEDEVVPSGTVVQAPAPSLARRKEVEELGEETTAFLGESEHDYLGRTYMHVPQDLGFSLTKEPGSVTNYIPKKLAYTWRPHGKPVTALQLFPGSSHLGLTGAADGMVKIWDVYRGREVLRSFSGHNKAITDLSFNNDGTKFLSGGFDRRIRLWDTETGQCVNRFNCGKTPHVIKFNPSAEHGHEFLAGLSDNRILQYDSRAGNETVQEYDHHLGAINTIEFIDESRRFMSTSDDRSLRVWEYGIPVEIKTIRYVRPLLLHPCMRLCVLTLPVNPTCSPSQRPPSTPAASTSSTNAATTRSSPTRPVPTSSASTARRPGAATTLPAAPSGSRAVRTGSLLPRAIPAVASASGTSRRARCTARSRPTALRAPSTALPGRSRRPARCLPQGPRARSRCGIKEGVALRGV
jgi:pre-mRNA-processing factor 17